MAYNKDEDYCSYSPDMFFGVNHNYACYLHDRQYRNEVKNRKTRKQADIDFRDRMYKCYSDAGYSKFGFIVSRIYYLGVRLFGVFAWEK